MDILMSLHKVWNDLIFSGEKPIEFRTKLPKDFGIGDKVYFYETGRKGGCRRVVGYATVSQIINVLSEEGKWPMCGAYPFIDFYYENVKGEKEIAEKYREVKKEFGKQARYRYGFILDYVFSELELKSLREDGHLLDTWSIQDEKTLKKIFAENDIGHKRAEECDNWLTKIGFYNDFGESYYKYGIVLTDIVKYEYPLPLTEFRGRGGETIQKAPQSWMYVLQKEV